MPGRCRIPADGPRAAAIRAAQTALERNDAVNRLHSGETPLSLLQLRRLEHLDYVAMLAGGQVIEFKSGAVRSSGKRRAQPGVPDLRSEHLRICGLLDRAGVLIPSVISDYCSPHYPVATERAIRDLTTKQGLRRLGAGGLREGLDEAGEEDRAEIIDLIEAIHTARSDGDAAALVAAQGHLRDLLFYLET